MPEPTPINPLGWCAPHLTRGSYVSASTLVGGTAMCDADAVAAMNASGTPSSGTTTGTTVSTKL